jgi:hypothetical protein
MSDIREVKITYIKKNVEKLISLNPDRFKTMKCSEAKEKYAKYLELCKKGHWQAKKFDYWLATEI